MPKPPAVFGPKRRTNPLTWFFAFVCAIVATTIIIVGIIVFVGYLAIRPKVPLLYVAQARLDYYNNNPKGVLGVRLMIILKAENHNVKAHVSFYHTKLVLSYHGLSIALLVADQFDLQKNTSQEFSYVVESLRIPLDHAQQKLTEESLEKTKNMPFVLKGVSRTRWKVGPLGHLKFWLHVNCHMFLPINNTVVNPHCRTTSHG